MKREINQLRAGVLLSYVNLALGSLIPMLYTPVMLRILGQAEHGLYALAGSTVGYLSLLSFGFGSTIIRYISKYRAEDDREGIRRSFGFFLLLYCGLAVLVIAGGGLMTWYAPGLFEGSLTASELHTMRRLLPLLSWNLALTFPYSVVNSVILAHERFLYRRIMDILATIIVPVLNLLMLYLGFASTGLAISSLIAQFLLFLPNVVYCTRRLGLTPSFRRIPGSLIREMIGFSGFVFLASIVDLLFWGTDKVILGMLMGSTAVSVYQIGGTFNSMVMQVSLSFSNVLAPKITGMVVREASDSQLSELFIRIGRIQFLVVALVVSGFAAFGRAFIDLWAGPGYQDAYWITVLTLFPLCIPLIQNTGLQILMARNQHKFRALVYLLIAVLNVISTWLVVPYLGGIGAALCSGLSYLAGQGVAINIYYDKVIRLDIPGFWKQIGKMSVIPLVMMVLTLLLQGAMRIEGWIGFFTAVAAYTAVYGAAMYCVCMNTYEKNLVRKPLSKLLRRLKQNWR